MYPLLYTPPTWIAGHREISFELPGSSPCCLTFIALEDDVQDSGGGKTSMVFTQHCTLYTTVPCQSGEAPGVTVAKFFLEVTSHSFEWI